MPKCITQRHHYHKGLSQQKNKIEKTQQHLQRKNKIDVLDILMTPFDEFNIYDQNEDYIFEDNNQIKVENQDYSLKS